MIFRLQDKALFVRPQTRNEAIEANEVGGCFDPKTNPEPYSQRKHHEAN